MLNLIWDVIKWCLLGPRLKLTIRPNVFYKDGEIVSREKWKDGTEVMTPSLYYRIEVINRGNRPTTIMRISATIKGYYSQDKTPASLISEAFTPHSGNKLPYVLKPGEVWSCRHDQSNMMQQLEVLGASHPMLKLYVSHQDKPIIKEMPV